MWRSKSRASVASPEVDLDAFDSRELRAEQFFEVVREGLLLAVGQGGVLLYQHQGILVVGGDELLLAHHLLLNIGY